MGKEFTIGLHAGKPEAEAAFVREYGPRVYAFIIDVVGDARDADELTADVFVKAFKAIRSYDPSKASLATWLLRIAHNAAISHLRHPKLPTSPLDKAPEPTEAEADEDPRVEILHRAIGQLAPGDRSLVHLHYFENARLSDIAYALGITEGAATVRLHRIRAKLKTLIENYHGE